MSNYNEDILWFYLSEAILNASYTKRGILDIINNFGSLQGLREAPSQDVLELVRNKSSLNIAKLIYRKLRSATEDILTKYQKEIDQLEKSNIKVINITNHNYPSRLKSIEDPPLVIFHKGNLKNFDLGHYIAIVGTRRSSHKGHYLARELARILAERGYVIVSGLARGIDTEAHCGALDVDGKTIAVLPFPIERVYPRENKDLSIDILERGALLTITSNFEYSKDHYMKSRFVERNKITSALSEVVVIVESGLRGGSIHQFNFAKKQGRRIYIPQPSDHHQSAYEGYKYLLKEGAIELNSAQDIIDFIESGEPKEKVKFNGLNGYIIKH